MSEFYDLVIIGGGLGGSTLAKVMGEAGADVLLVEREAAFRDRIRGETIHPWGVAETKALGVYEPLMNACAIETRYWTAHRTGGVRSRDLFTTTEHQAGELSFYHPAMQEQLIRLAAEAGVEVRRPATGELIHGPEPAVLIRDQQGERRVRARLIVGSDGRSSGLRRAGGFRTMHDEPYLRITAVLVDRIDHVDGSEIHLFRPSAFGQAALLFAHPDGRGRAYFFTGHRSEHARLSGLRDYPLLVRYCVESGVPSEWLVGAEPIGPLATFEGADSWVDHPYRNGVVLIGDAAAASDPSWGSGLALTLRDVRVLRDELLATDDWHAAANAYASEHDKYYAALHAFESWMTQVMYGLGPEADRCREFALPALAAGEGPDITGRGPDGPHDDDARRRFLGG
jgi:menaquinone-9 beta-reductase